MTFDFTRLQVMRTPQTYASTLNLHRRGLLSIGFLWELAGYDEVFGAYLRKHGVEQP